MLSSAGRPAVVLAPAVHNHRRETENDDNNDNETNKQDPIETCPGQTFSLTVTPSHPLPNSFSSRLYHTPRGRTGRR